MFCVDDVTVNYTMNYYTEPLFGDIDILSDKPSHFVHVMFTAGRLRMAQIRVDPCIVPHERNFRAGHLEYMENY